MKKKMGKKSLEAGWRINKLKPHVCRCLSFGEPPNNFVILKLEGAKHFPWVSTSSDKTFIYLLTSQPNFK